MPSPQVPQTPPIRPIRPTPVSEPAVKGRTAPTGGVPHAEYEQHYGHMAALEALERL
jgi:hypothetical protein